MPMLFIGHRESPLAGELVGAIPVKTSAGLGITKVFEIAVPDVATGDILVISAKAQVTNNLHKAPFNTSDHNVGVGCALGAVDAVGAAYQITAWTGGNVDARLHHATRLDAATWAVPAGVSGPLAVRFYLKSSALQARPSWVLRVDPGYGHLRVLHLRPA